jgi:cobalt-precorrin 5A hydrolase
MKTAVIAVTGEGARMAAVIASGLKGDLHIRGRDFRTLSDHIKKIFHDYSAFVFVMSLGIVNRVIAPLIRSKYSDPAVVVHDEVGRFVISALSGHEGGANRLAYRVSSITGAEPVITTATEANRKYICGVGCRKGVPAESIRDAILKGCSEADITAGDLRCLASAWVKGEEEGLLVAAADLGLYIRFIDRWQIDEFYKKNPDADRSEVVFRNIGVYGVSEPAALLAGRNTELVLKKRIFNGVTVAIAKERLFDMELEKIPEPDPRSSQPDTVLILGGTTEAMRVAAGFESDGREFLISTATEYGYELFRERFGNRVVNIRFTEESLTGFIRKKNIVRIIDCTHPYAEVITGVALNVCRKEGIEYVSGIRTIESSEGDGYGKLVSVSSLNEAADRILELGIRKPLFTTGSKDLSFTERLKGMDFFVRVLPYEDSIKACNRAGIRRQNIIAMQGPFSKEVNVAIINQFGIDCIVTKKSGREGGYGEKVGAAIDCGIWCIVVNI